MRAITSVSDGLMVAAGTVWSSFGSVMLLSTVSSTTGPATSPSPSPTLSPSPPPVILPASPSPTFSGTPSPATSPASPTPWPTFSPSPPHVIPPGSSSPAITPSPAPVTESGSWSPALAIALAASGTIVVALLALVLCHRRIRACLDTCYTTEEPASAVGPAPGNVSMDDGGHVVTGTLANRTSFSVHAADVVQEEKTDRSRRIMPSLVISARNISLPSINQGCSVEMSDEFPAYGAGVQQNAQHTPSCGVGSSDNLVGGDRTSGDLHKGTVADMQGTGISDTGIIPTVSTSESPLGAYDDSQSHDASADPVTIGVSTESDGDEMQASNSKGPSEDSDAHDGRASGSGSDLGVGLAQAILETAKELAQASSVPGVSAAATLVSVLVRLVVDHEGSGGAADGRLRWCRCIIVLLGKAAELLSKGGHALDESERVLLEDVRESIDDLIQLIQVYKSKNKMVRVITSSLFKRRQEELEATINLAVNRLQITLQLHGGHKLNAVGKDVKDMKHVLQVQQRTSQVHNANDVRKTLFQALRFPSSPSKVAEAAVAEIRRNRRQRRLEQLEIPEDELTLTDELLGKGGFGSVYMADYNGRNAAAKVVEIERDLGGDDGSDGQGDATDGQASDQSLERQKIQRRAFTRELEAMTRLRSPHTVHVYGAVTSRNDRLILVMELMSGGSLRAFLKRSSDPIEEEKAHRIVGEICAGMVFLHDQKTVHGDLKSANVLFDGYFRAKICDFGTSRWTQHTLSTGLATYTTNHSQITHMSLPWAAPEVLNKGERSFKSDVYSFGMVVWEVLTREVPWANETEPLDIYRRVVFKRERPDIPEGALADLADTVRSCWAANPSSRPSFTSILGDMKCKGWKTS